MKNRINKIMNSLLGSIITTLVILTGSFFIMMFSSNQDGMRKTYFNTLFFESITRQDGSVGIHFGLTGNFFPVIITVIILFVFYYLVQIFYEILNNYKIKLIEERKNNEK